MKDDVARKSINKAREVGRKLYDMVSIENNGEIMPSDDRDMIWRMEIGLLKGGRDADMMRGDN